MATVPAPADATPEPAPRYRNLRWWPVVVLFALMAVLRLVPGMLEGPGMAAFMTSSFGPVACAGLLGLWWLFYSRASVREKLVGAVVGVAMLVLAVALIHYSLQGMWVVMLVVPTAALAFSLTLAVLSRWKNPARVGVALAATALVLVYWNALQSEGVTGQFQSKFRWRWEKNSEEQYLATRGASAPAAEVPAESAAVPLGTVTWAGFRGPSREGAQPGVTLATDWTARPPKEAWKRLVGPGWSSFAVAGDRLYTQEQRGENEAVVCLDANSGKELWAHEYPARFYESVAGAGPRATPTIADGGLFAVGADGRVMRLDPLTGKPVWSRELKKDADRDPPMWGFAGSPLVAGGTVVVHAGGKAKGVLAYDAATGEPKWSAPSGDHSYASPQAASFDGTAGVLMATNTGLQFLDAGDGRVLWDHEWASEGYRSLQPLVRGNVVYFSTGFGAGTRRLEVNHADGNWKVAEGWTTKDMKSDFNDFVEHDGFLYGFDGGIFACVDVATGKRQWKKGRYGAGQVLLLPNAGQLLVVSEQGEIVLVRATPEKLDELGRFQAIAGKTWNHPVLVGDRLYVRNAEEAACWVLPTENAPGSGPTVALGRDAGR